MDNTSSTVDGKLRLPKKSGARLIFTAFVLIAALFSGCSKGYSRNMKLPSDPSISSGLGWAAVTSAYANVKKLARRQSADVAVVRRGTVFRCTVRKIDPEGQDVGGLWYEYADGSTGGWIHSSDLSIFSSEEQARTALGALRQD